MVSSDKISPNDSRVSHQQTTLNGRRYRKHSAQSHQYGLDSQMYVDYILGQPQNGQFRGTIFLIHGWPDMSFGWRYQIPALIKMGLRVVAPDMMGYGGTVRTLNMTRRSRN